MTIVEQQQTHKKSISGSFSNAYKASIELNLITLAFFGLSDTQENEGEKPTKEARNQLEVHLNLIFHCLSERAHGACVR